MRMTADDIIARYCGHRIGHRSEPPMNLHACKYGLGCEGKGCSHDGCPRRADEQSARQEKPYPGCPLDHCPSPDLCQRAFECGADSFRADKR